MTDIRIATYIYDVNINKPYMIGYIVMDNISIDIQDKRRDSNGSKNRTIP